MSSKLTGDAGEHYVAYMLFRLEVSVAVMSGGTRAVDLLATKDGSRSVALQVKTSAANSNPRQWIVGTRRPTVSADFFYVFCNIPNSLEADVEVFVVPSVDVDQGSTWHHSPALFKITKETEPRYRNNWKALLDALDSQT